MYALQQDLQPCLGEGEDLNSHLGTVNGTIVKFCLLRRMRFVLNLQIFFYKSQPENEVYPHSPIPTYAVSPHVSDLTHPMDSGLVLSMLRNPYLLEKGGGISQLGRQLMKVLGSKGVGMKEDVFLRFLMKRGFIHHITKSGWIPGGMRWTQWQEQS